MQSVRLTKRILAALVCFALLISYLPDMSFAAKAAEEDQSAVSSERSADCKLRMERRPLG